MAPQREWFEKDYYAVLGVASDASAKDITRAYRKLARENHPDANPGDAQAERVAPEDVLMTDDAPHREAFGATEAVGELYVVGVDPDAQGLGLGTAVTALALDHLTGAGLRTAILYTEADNAPAVRTYTRAGFERSAVDVMFGPGSALSGTASSPTSGTIGR